MKSNNETILVTGGAGYIGSHTTLALLDAGYDVVVLDNLSNSSSESLARVARLAGRAPRFILGDIRDTELLRSIFSNEPFQAVLHFAGLKSVGESAQQPLIYYDNNVTGSLRLCQAMATAGVYKLVFSSSATVYGDAANMPVNEMTPAGALTNPYGRSKRMVEEFLGDLTQSDSRWRIGVLRYFNPVGAHSSGLIGEDPSGVPGNLLPYISRVAAGALPYLTVFGGDYPTRDGTGVRDYIHVVDLARGHLSALKAMNSRSGLGVWNLGTGIGYSVMEMIRAFELASNQRIPYRVSARRSGDIGECWADAKKALSELGWKAERGLHEMMTDAWRWQTCNPNGYRDLSDSNAII